MTTSIVGQLRQLCDRCIMAPQNRGVSSPASMEPCCTRCELEHAAADEIERLEQSSPEPQWMDRPTEPGMYVCTGKKRCAGLTVVLVLTHDDLERGAPFDTSAVYGPIPKRESVE